MGVVRRWLRGVCLRFGIVPGPLRRWLRGLVVGRQRRHWVCEGTDGGIAARLVHLLLYLVDSSARRGTRARRWAAKRARVEFDFYLARPCLLESVPDMGIFLTDLFFIWWFHMSMRWCLDVFEMVKLLPLIFYRKTFDIWCLDAWQNFSHADTTCALRRFFVQFWVSWVPNAKYFAAQVLLFLAMVFRPILLKDEIKQQKILSKWGTKPVLSIM